MKPPGSSRVLIGIAGWAGHVYPALGLGRALRERGHEVLLETFERWHDVAESLDLRFARGPERVVFPGPPVPGDDAPTIEEAVDGTVELIRDFEPDVVVTDLFGIVPALAAERLGIRQATLVQHVWTEYEDRAPPFSWGFYPPRTRLAGPMWMAGRFLRDLQRRHHRPMLNLARERVGLPALSGTTPPMSDELVLVATYPQFEYPMARPSFVHITGPIRFDVPGGVDEPPNGDGPLVIVAGSTEQDTEQGLIGACLAGLADEGIRVLASLNRRGASWPGEIPPNARVVDWADYSALLPHAAAVITRGGHGTIVRALADGIPVLACPAGGDQAENATRLAWSGAGLMLPRRLLGPREIRVALARLLHDSRTRDRAAALAAWSRQHDGAARAAVLLESRFG